MESQDSIGWLRGQEVSQLSEQLQRRMARQTGRNLEYGDVDDTGMVYVLKSSFVEMCDTLCNTNVLRTFGLLTVEYCCISLKYGMYHMVVSIYWSWKKLRRWEAWLHDHDQNGAVWHWQSQARTTNGGANNQRKCVASFVSMFAHQDLCRVVHCNTQSSRQYTVQYIYICKIMHAAYTQCICFCMTKGLLFPKWLNCYRPSMRHCAHMILHRTDCCWHGAVRVWKSHDELI